MLGGIPESILGLPAPSHTYHRLGVSQSLTFIDLECMTMVSCVLLLPGIPRAKGVDVPYIDFLLILRPGYIYDNYNSPP